MTLTEILRLAGPLDDTPGDGTPRERFRAFLAETVTGVPAVRELLEGALRVRDEQHRRALQDLVNHCGRLLGFDVDFGRYHAGAQGSGQDGRWQAGKRLVVVRVIAEEADGEAGGISMAEDAGSEEALGLYVVAPQGPVLARLLAVVAENPDRLRVITIDSLLSIADVKLAFKPPHAEILRLLTTSMPSVAPAEPEAPPLSSRRRLVVVARDSNLVEHVKREFADGRTDVVEDRRVGPRRQRGYTLRILELRRQPDRRTRPDVQDQLRRLGYGIVFVDPPSAATAVPGSVLAPPLAEASPAPGSRRRSAPTSAAAVVAREGRRTTDVLPGVPQGRRATPAAARTLRVVTEARTEVIDLTRDVTDAVSAAGVREGVCTVFVPHATAAVIVSAIAEPAVCGEILTALDGIFPEVEGRHAAHLKAAMLGPSASIPVHEGRLALGAWQGIALVECDGPRTREIIVDVRP
jgi:secondary thiamine-phosphate synthase enzyme